YNQGEEHVFLGKEIHEHRDFSEGTAKIIDEEVQRILSDALERATELIGANRDKLDNLTEALLMHEELDTEDVNKVFAGVPIAELRKEPPKPLPAPSLFSEPEIVAPPAPPKPGLAFG